MDVADPAFPRSTAYWWFGCRSANKGTLGNSINRWHNSQCNGNECLWFPENSINTFLNDGDFFIPDSVDGDNNDVGDIILDAGIKASFESDQILTSP